MPDEAPGLSCKRLRLLRRQPGDVLRRSAGIERIQGCQTSDRKIGSGNRRPAEFLRSVGNQQCQVSNRDEKTPVHNQLGDLRSQSGLTRLQRARLFARKWPKSLFGNFDTVCFV